ncbi:MAG: YceI family protein [Gammaproteobacteria bacterium]|nr:YceI family protein [Gammaproteobacteria bacterium]
MMRLLIALSLLLFASAQAAEFSAVQADKSAISFITKQMNVPVEGVFRKFTAQIRIDPAKAEAGQARIEIDLAGIDAGSAEANEEVKGKNWFNVREFPQAGFISGSVKALGGGRFEASGRMTIKGRTRDVRAPFTLKQEKGVLILDGRFPLKRLDYGIGSGVWSDTAVVADEVQVRFHFVLK